MRFWLGLFLLLAFPLSAQQSRPFPDRDTFVREVRKRLQLDEDRQAAYAYQETRRQVKLDGKGRPQGESVKVIESYPGFPGEERWERVISEDGKPMPASELEKKDRKRQQEAEEFARKLAKQTDADRAKLAREREKEQREIERMVDDAFKVFDFQMIGRETIEDHETIMVSFAPRPVSTPQTRVGRMLHHFRGRAWISESEYELVKVDVEALDDLSFGMGLLARLHKGSQLTFQRRKVNGEVWLPAKSTYTASARVLLVRRMRVGGTSEFSDYRKFSVGTSTTYTTPSS